MVAIESVVDPRISIPFTGENKVDWRGAECKDRTAGPSLTKSPLPQILKIHLGDERVQTVTVRYHGCHQKQVGIVNLILLQIIRRSSRCQREQITRDGPRACRYHRVRYFQLICPRKSSQALWYRDRNLSLVQVERRRNVRRRYEWLHTLRSLNDPKCPFARQIDSTD